MDFPVREPHPFSGRWYSHKFRSAGVWYQVAVSIEAGEIAWINSPFPCGEWPDLRIFRSVLKKELADGKTVVVDAGYLGEASVDLPDGNLDEGEWRGMVRARHETLNGWLKNVNALKQVFHHDLTKHLLMFRAAAFMVQLTLKHEHKLYNI